MPTTVVEISGDEAGLLKSLRNVIEKEKEHERQLLRSGEAGAAGANEIERAMERVKNAADNQLKGYLTDLAKLGPEGRQFASELKSHFAETGKAGYQSIEMVIEQIRKIDPEAAAAMDSLKAEMKEAAASADAIPQNVEDGSKRSESAFQRFRKSAVGQITQIAGAYLGVQEAIQFVVEANRKVIETNKQIFEGLKINQSGDRRLLQVSESGEDFDRLRKKADELATKYGIDRQESRNLVFSARSEGFEGSLDFIAANNQQIDIASQAGVAGQVPTLFAGEGLTPEQAINATLAAAQKSRLSFEDIGRALPVASEGASLTGASSAETAGALAALASRFKSADTAADRLKALAIKFDLDTENGLADIGMTAGVEKLAGMSESDRSDFLGSSIELNTAFKIYLEELSKIKEFTASAQEAINATGTASSPTAIGRQIAGSDGKLRSLRDVAIAENALAVSREERRAEGEGGRQTSRNEALLSAEVRGIPEFNIGLAENVADTAATFGIADDGRVIDALTSERGVNAVNSVTTGNAQGFTGMAAQLLYSLFGGEDEDSRKQIKEQMQKQTLSLERIAANTVPPPPNPNAAIAVTAATSDARAAQ